MALSCWVHIHDSTCYKSAQLVHKTPITTAAEDFLEYSFNCLSIDTVKKIIVLSAAILFGSLMVKSSVDNAVS